MSKLRTIIAAVAAGIAFQFVSAANTASERVGDYTWSYSVVDGKAVIGVVDENGYPRGHQRAIEPEPVGAVEIPSTLGGYPVTEIGDYAFYSCGRMTALTFPPGVVRIGRFAISYQGGMAGIDLPDGLTEIAADAFFNCHGLTSVVIPSGVTNVGSSAFAGCYKLKSVTIPSSVQTLGDGVFSACCVLDTFAVDETNPCCKVVDGCLLTKDGKTLLRGPASERVVVPSCVEEVFDEAFSDCRNLRSVTFQEGVQTIGRDVFAWCDDLQTVFFPSTVTHIDEGIFRGCSQLSTIRVAEGNARYKCEDGFLLTKDGTVLLRAENMTAAVVPQGVTRLGGDCFSGSECLASVTLPEGLAEIGPDAFFRTGVKSLVIPATVNAIGDSAFDEALLSAVYFRGNAPECGAYIYGGVPDVVSYVLSGSTGWNGTPGSTELPEFWPVGDEFARPIDFWDASETYTVTFDLGEHGRRTGGGELMQAVERGRAAVAPIFDVSPGWSFLGWSCDFSAVTSELTVYATYGMEPYDERAREASVMLLNGWNWVSVNVEPADAVFASVFRGVAFADNDVIKSSDGSATYSNGTWHPNPSSFKLVPGRAYAVKKSTAGTATVTVNGTTVPARIAVAAGWNWIGPTTTSPVPIGDLVHTGGFTDGDIINSPCASATYHGGKWYGDLKALEPGSGYKARFGKAGTLR